MLPSGEMDYGQLVTSRWRGTSKQIPPSVYFFDGSCDGNVSGGAVAFGRETLLEKGKGVDAWGVGLWAVHYGKAEACHSL